MDEERVRVFLHVKDEYETTKAEAKNLVDTIVKFKLVKINPKFDVYAKALEEFYKSHNVQMFKSLKRLIVFTNNFNYSVETDVSKKRLKLSDIDIDYEEVSQCFVEFTNAFMALRAKLQELQ